MDTAENSGAWLMWENLVDGIIIGREKPRR